MAALGPIKLRQVAEHYANRGVLRTPRCFNNAERAPVERLGLRWPALLSVKLCQVMQRIRYLYVNWPKGFFLDCQRTL